jgi:hypothetical protein
MAGARLDRPVEQKQAPSARGRVTGRKRPWLSVLIPVTHFSDALRSRIAAVAVQAEPGVEVLLADCTGSQTAAAALSYLVWEWEGRLRMLPEMSPCNVNIARNVLLDAACGVYVWLLDGEDQMLPGAIGELATIVDRYKPDLVLCDSMNLMPSRQNGDRRYTPSRRMTFGGPAGTPTPSRWSLLCRLLSSPATPATCRLVGRRAAWNRGLRFPDGELFGDLATLPRLTLRADTYLYAQSVWVMHPDTTRQPIMTLDACDMLSAALVEFSREIHGLPCSSREVLFRVSHLCAQNFVRAAAHAVEYEDAQTPVRLGRYRRNFKLSTMMGIRQLLDHYATRGWEERREQLHHWLERCRNETSSGDGAETATANTQQPAQPREG